MAIGSDDLPRLAPVKGYALGVACAGIKQQGRRDVVIMQPQAGSTVAAVFTRNAFCAAPVTIAKANLNATSPVALLVNTGNANAGTGEQGIADAQACCAAVAELMACDASEVLPFSTGVIGEPLPVERIKQALPAAQADLAEDNWESAAWGILTTDTRPKGSSRSVRVGDQDLTITGISKGSGMIRPDMATMLAYVATDAAIAPDDLQQLVSDCSDLSFNRITVDGDTSTNDACVLTATGASGISLSPADPHWGEFREAMEAVFVELAQAIIKDGEGVTKFVSIQVDGGNDAAECLAVAYTVAHSPLVKTALFASDANWGRILAAVGRAGVQDLDVDAIRIWLGDVLIAERGGRAAAYTEEQGAAAIAGEEVLIRIDLARGECSETVWTTDLSHEYIKINAEYRT